MKRESNTEKQISVYTEDSLANHGVAGMIPDHASS